MLSKIISPPKVFKSFFLERNIFRRTKLFLKSFSANEIFFGQRNIFRPAKYFSAVSNLFRPTKNISAVSKFISRSQK